MRTLLLIPCLVAVFACACDRRKLPENQPEPQPSHTSDAEKASDAAPSGEPRTAPAPSTPDEPSPDEP